MDRVALAVISGALVGILVFCNNTMLSTANAITYGEGGMPISLSGDEFVIVRDTALSDPRVQELIAGRNYVISDCCGFVQNGSSSSWQPVINLSVANELQIAVSVDLSSRKVTAINTMPFIQLQVPKSDSTAAEEVLKRSSNNNDDDGMTSVPFLATNTSTVLPLILTIGAVIGGAAAVVFYYYYQLKKKDNQLSSEEKV